MLEEETSISGSREFHNNIIISTNPVNFLNNLVAVYHLWDLMRKLKKDCPKTTREATIDRIRILCRALYISKRGKKPLSLGKLPCSNLEEICFRDSQIISIFFKILDHQKIPFSSQSLCILLALEHLMAHLEKLNSFTIFNIRQCSLATQKI